MKPKRTLHPDLIGLALVVMVAAVWIDAREPDERRGAQPTLQVAQDEYAEPIGEDDAPVGGAMVGGEPVGDDDAPIGGAMVDGAPVGEGDAPIGGAMVDGAPVGEGDAAIGGPMVDGDAVQQGDEGAPIGGDTLY